MNVSELIEAAIAHRDKYGDTAVVSVIPTGVYDLLRTEYDCFEIEQGKVFVLVCDPAEL